MHVLLRLLINAAALWVATRLVSGISYTGDGVSLFGVALVFGVLNVLIKPILFVLSFPFVIFTLGLFTLVINAVMLLLTAAASDALGLGFAWTASCRPSRGRSSSPWSASACRCSFSDGNAPKPSKEARRVAGLRPVACPRGCGSLDPPARSPFDDREIASTHSHAARRRRAALRMVSTPRR